MAETKADLAQELETAKKELVKQAEIVTGLSDQLNAAKSHVVKLSAEIEELKKAPTGVPQDISPEEFRQLVALCMPACTDGQGIPLNDSTMRDHKAKIVNHAVGLARDLIEGTR